MNTGKSELFDVPHNECPTVFSPDNPGVERNNDGTFSLYRQHLIPAKSIGSSETTRADNLWLGTNNHWNTAESRVTFSDEESARAHWKRFCDAN